MANDGGLLKKIEHNQIIIAAHRPLDQTQLKNLKEYFKIGLTYASNALEGNTLTETETKAVVEEGLTIGGKPLKDHLEAIGHARAFEYIWQLAKSSELKERDIKKLHQICFQPRDNETAGKYRKVDVIISGSRHNEKIPKHQDVPEQMRRFAEDLGKMRAALRPVEYAAMTHRNFVYIHPFEDGNGRVARLLMNHALFRAGYPPVIISPFFKHEYLAALEESREDSKVFVGYIAERVLEAQGEYLRLLGLKHI